MTNPSESSWTLKPSPSVSSSTATTSGSVATWVVFSSSFWVESSATATGLAHTAANDSFPNGGELLRLELNELETFASKGD